MADTVNATGLRVTQWDAKYFEEWIGENRFAPYQGEDENAVIQMKEDLTKKKGDRLNFALVNRLTNDATTGTNTLVGNEEDMTSRSHLLTVDKRRNAVVVPEMSEQRSAIPLRNAAKSQLKMWSMADYRTLILRALNSIRDGTTPYPYTTGAEVNTIGATLMNQWLVDNADRHIWGTSATGGTVFATQHALLDNTNDKMRVEVLTGARILAENASPRITPIRTKGDEEWYVAYMNSYQYRDLVLNDSIFLAAQREARERSKDNPLFRGADAVWDGIIIKKIPELATIAASAITSGSTVATAQAFLCGAQALGVGIAKRWTSKERTEDDYGDKFGVAIEQIYGVEKLCFGTGSADTDDLKQNGVVSMWTASVA